MPVAFVPLERPRLSLPVLAACPKYSCSAPGWVSHVRLLVGNLRLVLPCGHHVVAIRQPRKALGNIPSCRGIGKVGVPLPVPLQHLLNGKVRVVLVLCLLGSVQVAEAETLPCAPINHVLPLRAENTPECGTQSWGYSECTSKCPHSGRGSARRPFATDSRYSLQAGRPPTAESWGWPRRTTGGRGLGTYRTCPSWSPTPPRLLLKPWLPRMPCA
jgi:hypothetical protein